MQVSRAIWRRSWGAAEKLAEMKRDCAGTQRWQMKTMSLMLVWVDRQSCRTQVIVDIDMCWANKYLLCVYCCCSLLPRTGGYWLRFAFLAGSSPQLLRLWSPPMHRCTSSNDASINSNYFGPCNSTGKELFIEMFHTHIAPFRPHSTDSIILARHVQQFNWCIFKYVCYSNGMELRQISTYFHTIIQVWANYGGSRRSEMGADAPSDLLVSVELELCSSGVVESDWDLPVRRRDDGMHVAPHRVACVLKTLLQLCKEWMKSHSTTTPTRTRFFLHLPIYLLASRTQIHGNISISMILNDAKVVTCNRSIFVIARSSISQCIELAATVATLLSLRRMVETP